MLLEDANDLMNLAVMGGNFIAAKHWVEDVAAAAGAASMRRFL